MQANVGGQTASRGRCGCHATAVIRARGRLFNQSGVGPDAHSKSWPRGRGPETGGPAMPRNPGRRWWIDG